MNLRNLRPVTHALKLSIMCVALLLAAAEAFAQSSDVSYPAPVFSPHISGRITPRDIGDARLTRHFYTFNGQEGDLVINLESAELNGDVDIFTAVTLRPLTKITLYASSSATKVSKTIYLRKAEPLVLRVEARSVGDAVGSYSINFAGSFAPASGTLAPLEPPVPALPETSRRDKNTQRVTSIGARIDEPEVESAAAPESTSETGTESEETNAPPATTRAHTSRRNPARASSASRNRTPRIKAPSVTAETARENSPTETSNTGATSIEGVNRSTVDESLPASEPTPRPARTSARTPRRRGSRPARRNAPPATENGETPDATSSPAPLTSLVVTATRLVVETKDGGRIERDMNSVRRVAVENNQLVILNRSGKVEKVPMANIARMSIEP